MLAAFGALLRGEIRASDLAGRTGGEEFAILLPDTNREGAINLAEKVRTALHRLRVKGVDRARHRKLRDRDLPRRRRRRGP